MAYNQDKIYEQTIEEIKRLKLVLMEDVITLLPCSKSTFYDFFPIESNKLNYIKKELNNNKVEIKAGLRKKMYDSNSPSDRIALYKLIGTEEEAHRLNGSSRKIDHTSGGKPIGSRLGWTDDDDEEE